MKKRKPVDIDDIIGEPPAPVLIKELDVTAPIAVVEQGVYLSGHRNSAIVTGVTKEGIAHTVRLFPSGITFVKCSTSRFASDYSIALPNYPVRRAARIYLNSPLPKDAQADRLLRALLRA